MSSMFGLRRRKQLEEGKRDPYRLSKTQSEITLDWEFGAHDDNETLYTVTLPNHAKPNPPSRPLPTQPLRQTNGSGLGARPLVEEASTRDGRATPWRQQSNGARPSTSSHLTDPFRGDNAPRRLLATRKALDEAVDRWWTNGEVASLELLRDGLLLLEAGHDLDEGQRSLLLRTALALGRGIVTAVHHQTDVDRIAFLLKEAFLDLRPPIAPTLLWWLIEKDDRHPEWAPLLQEDLAYELSISTGERRALALAALRQLKSKDPILTPSLLQGLGLHNVKPSGGMARAWPRLPSQVLSGRLLLWASLMLAAILLYAWLPRTPYAGMASIPAGAYQISDPLAAANSNPLRSVTVSAFYLDRTEVTNSAYRTCYQQQECPAPATLASATQTRYFEDPAFDNFPVVNVTWSAAAAYCRWAGKRLPTIEEWEIAAAVAPATQGYFQYPWGNQFDKQLANSAAGKAGGDTKPVGQYNPAGNSSFGLLDMAGNVAEWTASSVGAANAASGVAQYVIKGGSYRDAPEQLRNQIRQVQDATKGTNWLGFRCIVGALSE